MFITAASTISHQPTFRNPGFSVLIRELQPNSELVVPDYSEFIPAMERRRMSQVQKMSISCSLDCLGRAGIERPDAIIVGTSMGCCVNTRSFLDKILEANEGPLSPTNFIVSTHNTIAGQIALLLKNHGYNMTYTQNSLSFEQGLIDAMVGVKGGFHHVLVGGADEEEYSLYNMPARLGNDKLHLTSGASFFILTNEKPGKETVSLVDVGSFGLVGDAGEATKEFLLSGNLSADEIDLVLYSVSQPAQLDEMNQLFRPHQLRDYQKLSGAYYTNSAFAMHYGIDLLLTRKESGIGLNNILICNSLVPENLGLILLSI